jgi:DNA-binding transcriptional ArsR family regulator
MIHTTKPITSRELAALLCHPAHLKAMGSAVRTFLWLWAHITDRGRWGGLVCGGRPVKLAEIARSMRISPRSISRDLASLRDGGYLDSDFEGSGFIGSIWIWKPDKSGEAKA